MTALTLVKSISKKGFAGKHTAPLLSENGNLDLAILIDNASIERFADSLTTMTEMFFPDQLSSDIKIQSTGILKSDRYTFAT